MPNRLKKRTQAERMAIAKTLLDSVLDELREGIYGDDTADISVLASAIKETATDIKLNAIRKVMKEWKDG